MQQTVLLTAIRGPDGVEKYGAVKSLLRWFRRCVLVSALDKIVLSCPWDTRGGSFTGPSCGSWAQLKHLHGDYLKAQDALPFHFQMHFMHAVEILGYHHPDAQIRADWNSFYERLVSAMHLHPESREELDRRLGDTREGWIARADPATVE